MVLGLTTDFLKFLGEMVGLLLLVPITLLAGYFLVLAMDWLADHVLILMGRRP